MELQVLLTGIIALCAVLSALGFIFKLLLNPVTADIIELKADIKTLENGQKTLENGQKALETGQKELNAKLDQLLNKSPNTT